MSELWIVRHGETEWSRDGRHTSVTDLPLTDEGVRVAATLASSLGEVDFDLVLSSPRLRARRTAELAGFASPELTEDLAEWAYGDYEGVTTEEIRRTVPGWTVFTHPTPAGEGAKKVAERLDRVIDRVRSHERVLAFSHGHALRCLAARWLGEPVASGRLFHLDTATTSVLGIDRDNPVVRRWNC